MNDDLISRSEVVKTLDNIEIGKFNRVNVIETIKAYPTIERPQGVWNYRKYNFYCSNCGNGALEMEEYPYLSTYCPFCGAEMEIET